MIDQPVGRAWQGRPFVAGPPSPPLVPDVGRGESPGQDFSGLLKVLEQIGVLGAERGRWPTGEELQKGAGGKGWPYGAY